MAHDSLLDSLNPRNPTLTHHERDERSLTDIASDINSEHRQVCAAVERGVEHARRAGELLLAAKERVPHGEWLPWLAANCEVSVRMAQNYMRIAREWPALEDAADSDAQRVAHLPLRKALALLAATREGEGTAPEGGPASVLFGASQSIPLAEVSLPDWGWHNTDALPHESDAPFMEKLANNIRRHGQLMPVVVRETAQGYEIVDGRSRLSVLRQLNATHVEAVNVGAVTAEVAVRLAIDLELGAKVDYAELSFVVKAMSDADGEPATLPQRLATTSPWDAERIGHFVQLAHWDWSQYDDASDGHVSDPDVAPADEPAAAIEETYRCPCCAYEWSGNPRLWRRGGRAMADARDRRNGVGRVRLIYTVADKKEFTRQERALRTAFATADMNETVAEAVRRAYAALADKG